MMETSKRTCNRCEELEVRVNNLARENSELRASNANHMRARRQAEEISGDNILLVYKLEEERDEALKEAERARTALSLMDTQEAKQWRDRTHRANEKMNEALKENRRLREGIQQIHDRIKPGSPPSIDGKNCIRVALRTLLLNPPKALDPQVRFTPGPKFSPRPNTG